MNFEYSIASKWLELLRELAPRLTRVAVLRDTAIAAGSGQLGAIQSAATQLGLELRPVGMREAGEIERGLVAFSSASNGGLIVTASPMNTVHRDLIIALAARHKLPAIASNRLFAAGGGLMSFGPDRVDRIYYERSFVKGGGLISYGTDLLADRTGAQRVTSIASSWARSQATCRCSPRQRSNWPSTSRPRKRSDSKCRPRCSPAPMR